MPREKMPRAAQSGKKVKPTKATDKTAKDKAKKQEEKEKEKVKTIDPTQIYLN